MRRAGIVLLSLTLWLPLSRLAAEEEKELRDLLREALYTEEVTRDAEAAAKQYEALLSQHEAQRAFAASALFRLAEVRRKQDRKDDAIALYQKLLTRYPEAETEAKLARENLAALGGKVPEANAPADDAEEKELKRLQELARTNPDAIRKRSILSKAVKESWLGVVKFYLEKNPGFDLNATTESVRFTPLDEACDVAALEVCRILIDAGADPDAPENRDALVSACSAGHLRIVELLVDRGADPNGHGTQEPLRWAVTNEQKEVASYLVKKGAKLNLPLTVATVADGSVDLVRRVRDEEFGSPLHVATAMESTRMVEFLLKLGADPNVAEPTTGLTALHVAVNPILKSWSQQSDFRGNAAAIPLLLKAGAKPDPESKAFAFNMPGGNPSYPAGITPLALAVQAGNMEAAKQLIEAGASAKRPGLAAGALGQPVMLELLLKHGADPNQQDKEGDPVLVRSIASNHLPAVRLLLEAGADPNKHTSRSSPLEMALFDRDRQPMVELLLAKGAKPDGALVTRAIQKSDWKLAMRLLDAGAPLPETPGSRPENAPFVEALKSADALPLIKRMVEMGARPEDAWIKSNFYASHYGSAGLRIPFEVRSYLFRTFMLPQLEDSEGIRSVHQEDSATMISVLEGKSPSARPKPLAQMLLEPQDVLRWSRLVAGADRLTIWRKTQGEWKAAHEFALSDGFPAIEWGDVIELTDGPKDVMRPAPAGFAPPGDMSPELKWLLRQQVTFPITVEIDGKAQEVTLRGDRVVFDPGSPREVPLGGARSVMALLWQPVTAPEDWQLEKKVEITLRREGWPDVKLPFKSTGKDFPLQAGDRISLNAPVETDEVKLRQRRSKVAVMVPNAPFCRSFGVESFTSVIPIRRGDPESVSSGLHKQTIPSLLQALAEVIQDSSLDQAPSDAALIPAWLSARGTSVAFLQRPDFSKSRIRRLAGDGTEKVIDVDLAKIIAETAEDATPEHVRVFDVALEAGDIVEVPLLPADDKGPWAGLSAKEAGFFSKALSCRVQVTDPQGGISLKDIVYRAPRMLPTPAGLVSLPSSAGTSSLVAWIALLPPNRADGATFVIDREPLEEVTLPAADIFLRDGDRISFPSQPKVPVIPSPSR